MTEVVPLDITQLVSMKGKVLACREPNGDVAFYRCSNMHGEQLRGAFIAAFRPERVREVKPARHEVGSSVVTVQGREDIDLPLPEEHVRETIRLAAINKLMHAQPG